MRNYKTLFSFSFRDYGDNITVMGDKCKEFICMTQDKGPDGIAWCYQRLAAYLLEAAHYCEHSEDFVAPDFDKEHREKQLDKVREMMKPVFVNDD